VHKHIQCYTRSPNIVCHASENAPFRSHYCLRRLKRCCACSILRCYYTDTSVICLQYTNILVLKHWCACCIWYENSKNIYAYMYVCITCVCVCVCVCVCARAYIYILYNIVPAASVMLSSPHYVSIRQHTSAYVSIRQRMLTCCLCHAVITRPSEGRCCAEIGYFHSAVGCQQQVLGLYISMYNAVLMQILEACIRQNTSA